MEYKSIIPSHLPVKLSICYWGWDWLVAIQKGEAYEDLDRAVRETKERGFNCIRPDMGLGLIHDSNGGARGNIRFRARFPGENSNLQCINTRGGAECGVLDRVIHLLELADKYGIFIIGTTWLYQDLVADIDSEDIRREITAIPYNERIPYLVSQWDWILGAIKKRGLLHRLAFVELINEMDGTPCIWPREEKDPPTYEDWLHEKMVPAKEAWMRQLAGEALARLQERYPELLITTDMCHSGNFTQWLPENVPIADHHLYHDSVTLGIIRAAGVDPGAKEFSWDIGPLPDENNLLSSLLKKDVMNWKAFNDLDTHTRQNWRVTAWFYQNIDNDKYDAWCRQHIHEYKEKVVENVRNVIKSAVDFAHPRGLPLVIDEGYLLFPPLNSRFLMEPDGRWGEELVVDAAVDAGYWGVTPTSYFRPNTPLGWYDDGQCDWILNLNRKILGK